MKTLTLLPLMLAVALSACGQNKTPLKKDSANSTTTMQYKVIKTDEEWKRILTPEQYRITRQKGTERPFTGEYNKNHDKGTFVCVCCRNELFSSDAKFESGTGWPSFYQPIAKDKVQELNDREFGMVRTEVVCANCGAHLGHVFPDGPAPTGLRYCMNSAALKLVKK